jgi:hypothetical protein
MRFQRLLVVVGLSAVCAAACGGPPEPKSPDEQIAEEETKLEDMEKEGGGQGTELEAKDAEDEMKAAEEEKAEEAPADAPAEAPAE